MAVEDGVATLAGLGTTTVTGYIVLSIREAESGEDLEIFDEDGDVVTHLNTYGIKKEVEIEVIPKSGTAKPSIGDTFTFTSKTNGATQKITVLSIDPAEAQKDVVRWTIRGKSFAGISL